MSKDLVYDRLLCQESGLDYPDVWRNYNDPRVARLLSEAEGALAATILPRLRILERKQLGQGKDTILSAPLHPAGAGKNKAILAARRPRPTLFGAEQASARQRLAELPSIREFSWRFASLDPSRGRQHELYQPRTLHTAACGQPEARFPSTEILSEPNPSEKAGGLSKMT